MDRVAYEKVIPLGVDHKNRKIEVVVQIIERPGFGDELQIDGYARRKAIPERIAYRANIYDLAQTRLAGLDPAMTFAKLSEMVYWWQALNRRSVLGPDGVWDSRGFRMDEIVTIQSW